MFVHMINQCLVNIMLIVGEICTMLLSGSKGLAMMWILWDMWQNNTESSPDELTTWGNYFFSKLDDNNKNSVFDRWKYLTMWK